MDNFPYIKTLLTARLKMLKVKTAIDVGAYTGEMAGYLASKFKGITVHAIEPCFESLKYIKHAARGRLNIKVHRLAIKSYDGETVLYVESSKKECLPSASNTTCRDVVNSTDANKVKIPCLTLASFCKRNDIANIDLLRINAEGAEYEMFSDKKSRETILRAKIIDLSLHGKHSLFVNPEYSRKKYEIYSLIKKSGYRLLYGREIANNNSIVFQHVRHVWIKI